jgi:hypothetical protein
MDAQLMLIDRNDARTSRSGGEYRWMKRIDPKSPGLCDVNDAANAVNARKECWSRLS